MQRRGNRGVVYRFFLRLTAVPRIIPPPSISSLPRVSYSLRASNAYDETGFA